MSDSIVVGTDGSDTASRALDEAIRLAKALDAEVHVVSAYEPLRGAKVRGAPEGAAKVYAPLPDTLVTGILEQATTKVRLTGLKAEGHPVQEDPADALLTVADEVGAQLIVVGSKGMHGAKRMLGSVPNHVSHHAHCNVLIVSTDGA
ncbi:MAG TPA: universal stress protein [Solirubrobacteraceae bacterium]|nr:universal stress protein [Solirubrobacteraceae bacterium]